MRPIKIRIRKKTLVRTKHQARHKYRSDWKLVGVIDYIDSFKIFKSINGTGLCENEAQFAKILYKNYGSGIYSCIAWIRGRGDGRFFGFWKGELTPDGFMRLPKTITDEMKEKKVNILQFKKLKKQLDDDTIDSATKLDVQYQMTELEEELGFNTEIIELENDNTHGPSGYLKANIPIYKLHAYEEHIDAGNVKEVKDVDFW